MKNLMLAVVLICLLAPPLFSQYQVGDPVNDFTLLDSQGNSVSLSDYPDRIMFLTFWETG